MTAPERKTAREIFKLALEIQKSDRESFVRQIAGADHALANRVLELLHELTSELTTPPLMPERSKNSPDQIGPYRILGFLGEGGFGDVYEAEQSEPIRRRVAIKILKAGMDTEAVVSRFNAERQALASMNHQGIAKVIDGGVTLVEQGSRPYFVMELIRGESITTYCDKNQLPIKERIQLFTQVCEAIQHAHSKGIIHRDIKPSNILVASGDKGVAPKVIDFGVAKAISGQLSTATIFTAQGHMIGTPEYMSPEQAEMSGSDIDTRSDVYSLGVVLYELLSGKRPFERAGLQDAAAAEIKRIIREDEPPKPSSRISTVISSDAELASKLGKARRALPRQLEKNLRGELDWVVMKCLEKNRERRYSTPDAVAMELHRFLQDLPVLAGPPSLFYKTSKFIRRHRISTGSAAVISLVILASLAMALRMWVVAEQRRVIAETHRIEAETEKSKAVAFSDSLQRVITVLTVTGNDVSGRLGSLETRRTLAQASLLALKEIGEGDLTDPWMDHTVSLASIVSGDALIDTDGSLEETHQSYQLAHDRLLRLEPDAEFDPPVVELLLRSILGLGRCELRGQDGPSHLSQRLREARAVIRDSPDSIKNRSPITRLAIEIERLEAEVARELQNFTLAETKAQRAVESAKSLVTAGDRSIAALTSHANTLQTLGEIYAAMNQNSLAEEQYLHTLEIRREIYAKDPLASSNRRQLIDLFGKLSRRSSEPEPYLVERLDLALNAYVIEPSSRWTSEDVVTSIESFILWTPDSDIHHSAIKSGLIDLALTAAEVSSSENPTDLYVRRRLAFLKAFRGKDFLNRGEAIIAMEPEPAARLLAQSIFVLSDASSMLAQLQAFDPGNHDLAKKLVSTELMRAKAMERLGSIPRVDQASSYQDVPSQDDILEAYTRVIESAELYFEPTTRPAGITTQLAIAYRIRATIKLNEGSAESVPQAIADFERADLLEPLPTAYGRGTAMARLADAYRLAERFEESRLTANRALEELGSSDDSGAESFRQKIQTQILDKLPPANRGNDPDDPG